MQKDITENSLQKGCSFNLIKSEKQKCRTKTVVEFKKKSIQLIFCLHKPCKSSWLQGTPTSCNDVLVFNYTLIC